MHLVVVFVQVGRHGRAAHPHHLGDVLGEEEADRDDGRQDAEGAECAADGEGERGVAGSEGREWGEGSSAWLCRGMGV